MIIESQIQHTDNDNDNIDSDTESQATIDYDEYFPVIRYTTVELVSYDRTVNRRVPVLCPVCATADEQDSVEYYGRNEQGVIHESQLVTAGHESAHTTCVNDDCEYETVDPRQIRNRSYDDLIGPKKDYDRPRYDHSEKVRLNGGFAHVYDW